MNKRMGNRGMEEHIKLNNNGEIFVPKGVKSDIVENTEFVRIEDAWIQSPLSSPFLIQLVK